MESTEECHGINFTCFADSRCSEAVLELERKHGHEWTAAFQLVARPAFYGRVRDQHDDEQQQPQHFEHKDPPGDGVLKERKDNHLVSRPRDKTT